MTLFYRWNRWLHPGMTSSAARETLADLKLTRRPPGMGRPALDLRRRGGLGKTQAEDLMDWLEAHGCPHLEVTATNDRTFAVSWWN